MELDLVAAYVAPASLTPRSSRVAIDPYELLRTGSHHPHPPVVGGDATNFGRPNPTAPPEVTPRSPTLTQSPPADLQYAAHQAGLRNLQQNSALHLEALWERRRVLLGPEVFARYYGRSRL
jgi:hypothetical protein